MRDKSTKQRYAPSVGQQKGQREHSSKRCIAERVFKAFAKGKFGGGHLRDVWLHLSCQTCFERRQTTSRACLILILFVGDQGQFIG